VSERKNGGIAIYFHLHLISDSTGETLNAVRSSISILWSAIASNWIGLFSSLKLRRVWCFTPW
jgi:hypothetical protein